MVGAALLAGGKSRRMGRDKNLLDLDGETFQAHIAAQLADFPERLLSVADQSYDLPGFTSVADLLPDRGPLGGLYSLLAACRSEALLVVPCDVPFFSRDLAHYLAQALTAEWEAVIPVTRDGREHPACGVYRKTILPRLYAQLSSGDGRMRTLLAALRTHRIYLKDTPFPDRCLTNVNTPESYEALLSRNSSPSFF